MNRVADLREMKALALSRGQPPNSIVGISTLPAYKVIVQICLGSPQAGSHQVLLAPFLQYLFHLFQNLQLYDYHVFLVLVTSCVDYFNTWSPYLHNPSSPILLADSASLRFLKHQRSGTE